MTNPNKLNVSSHIDDENGVLGICNNQEGNPVDLSRYKVDNHIDGVTYSIDGSPIFTVGHGCLAAQKRFSKFLRESRYQPGKWVYVTESGKTEEFESQSAARKAVSSVVGESNEEYVIEYVD